MTVWVIAWFPMFFVGVHHRGVDASVVSSLHGRLLWSVAVPGSRWCACGGVCLFAQASGCVSVYLWVSADVCAFLHSVESSCANI